jgi:hypothetical protein
MNDIKVFNNFLPKKEICEVLGYVNSINIWGIQTSSSERNQYQFLIHDVSNNEYFNKHIFKYVQNIWNENYEIQRIYFNGQWPGRDGDLHEDGCKKTVLIYISEYYPNWGGFTQFVFSDNSEFIVSPVQNRLVCFSGNILHKGYSFSHQSCPMRVSLAFKLI